MKKKKIIAIVLSAAVAVSCMACGKGKTEEKADSGNGAALAIAYQYGMAYAPLEIMKAQNLIEEAYDGDVEVTWQELNSGAAINEGVAGGSIDVGAMGVGPAVTGIMAGVPYKIFSNMSAQPHAIMTNSEDIQSLSDIKAEDKIAAVNVGSIQHVLLALASEKELGDARALDENLQPLSHPDGMQALISGSVACQVTTSPYIYQELEQENIHMVTDLTDVWPEGNSFIVALASTKLHDENPDLYNAVVEALSQAIDFMNEKPEEAADILAEKLEVEPETILEWMEDPACQYSTKTQGVMDTAQFMAEQGFIDKGPEEYSELIYDNVQGD